MKKSCKSACGDSGHGVNNPCESGHTVSPAGQHDTGVPAFSRSGSHLFGSDGGAGFPLSHAQSSRGPSTDIASARGYLCGSARTSEGSVWAKPNKPTEINRCRLLEHKRDNGNRIRSAAEMSMRVRRLDSFPKGFCKTAHLRVRERKLSAVEIVLGNKDDLCAQPGTGSQCSQPLNT